MVDFVAFPVFDAVLEICNGADPLFFVYSVVRTM